MSSLGEPVVTSSRFRFVSADGASTETAVRLLDCPLDMIPRAEHEYLREVHAPSMGWAAPEVDLVSQALVHGEAGVYDMLELAVRGETRRVYFDISVPFSAPSSECPAYLPDVRGFARDVTSGRAWLRALGSVLGTLVFMAAVLVLYLALRT